MKRPVEVAGEGPGWDPAAGPVHVLLNPAGGQGRAGRRWARVEPALRAIFPDLIVEPSAAPGALTDRARQVASRAGPAMVLAAGGDGTSHEVINGLISDGRAGNPEVRLGWVPLGSGNDLAITLGFSPIEDSASLYRRLEPARIDLGLVTTRDIDGRERTIAFGNSMTVGITTEVVRRVGAGGKALGGRLSYGLGAARALLGYRPPELAVSIDGQSVREPAWLISITNGPRFGAGMRIAPGARLDDGRLDVVRVAGCSRLALLSIFPRVYWGGHLGHRGIDRRTATSIVIDSGGPIDFEADGELHSALSPLRVSIVPAGLPIVRPAGGSQS